MSPGNNDYTHGDFAGKRVPKTANRFRHDGTQSRRLPQSSYREWNSDEGFVILFRFFLTLLHPRRSSLSSGLVERDLLDFAAIIQPGVDNWMESFGDSIQPFIDGDPFISSEVDTVVNRAPQGTGSTNSRCFVPA